MTRDELKQLLRELNISSGKYPDYKDSGDNIMICCPFHGERNPSCGISVTKLTGQCFSCGETFNLPKLIAHCKGWTHQRKSLNSNTYTIYDYAKADEWLEEKFNIEKKVVKKDIIKRIDVMDLDDPPHPQRHELPRTRLAVYKSGKVAHKYLLDRGFTKDTLKKFMIGWDDDRKRVTIPVFWEDGALCGIIGRAVLDNKKDGVVNRAYEKVYGAQPKYYIYDNFPVGEILFPLPHFQLVDDMAVLVEGTLDAMYQHQNGFPMFLSTFKAKMFYNNVKRMSNQIELLKKMGVKKVLLLRDNDEAGIAGAEHDYKLLKYDFKVYTTAYPEGIKDPQQIDKVTMEQMLSNMYPYKIGKSLNRIL